MSNLNLEAIIEINNIKKIYEIEQFGIKSFKNDFKKFFFSNINSNVKKIIALNEISLKIYKGDTVALIGKNGSGKSTLMKILSGITKPTNGEVILKGNVTSALQGSFAFQSDLTARDNIYQFCAFKGLNNKKTKNIFNTIVNFAECEKFINTPMKRFSSGMSMKLALSIAVNIPGEIMIFDEIFNYIDEEFKRKIINFIKEKLSGENRTLILVSHDFELLKALCKTAIVLDDGKVSFYGKLKDVPKK